MYICVYIYTQSYEMIMIVMITTVVVIVIISNNLRHLRLKKSTNWNINNNQESAK